MNSSPNEIFHDHKPKTVSNPRKQNKNMSQNNIKFFEDIITRERFRILKLIMHCCF